MTIKLKNLAINLGTIFISFAVGVAIAEAGVRIAKLEGLKKMPEGSHADFSPTFFLMPDPVLGWSARPNASGVYQNENTATVQINSGGFRGTEVAKTKPESTFRIALLGDSFAMAVQVELEETFAKVIEGELGKCEALGERKVEVLNFGVNGYGTAQQLLTLQQKVWGYQPDMVILAFFISNDVTDNSQKLENNHYRPFFLLDENGDLVLNTSFTKLGLSQSDRYSITMVDRLPAELVNNVKLLQLMKKIEADKKQRSILQNFEKLAANNFKEPPDAAWREAWQITEKLLGKVAQEVGEKDAEFLVVTIGTPMQVHPDKQAREAYLQLHQIDDLFYPGNRVKGVGDRENFPVLNLERDMQAYVDKTGECLHGFSNEFCGGHWNQKGHQLAGELISQQLCVDFQQSK